MARSESGLQTQIPEMDEQVMIEVHHLTPTVAKQHDKIEKMQTDAVEDAKGINKYLNQLHAMETDLVKKPTSDDNVVQHVSGERAERVTEQGSPSRGAKGEYMLG